MRYRREITEWLTLELITAPLSHFWGEITSMRNYREGPKMIDLEHANGLMVWSSPLDQVRSIFLVCSTPGLRGLRRQGGGSGVGWFENSMENFDFMFGVWRIFFLRYCVPIFQKDCIQQVPHWCLPYWFPNWFPCTAQTGAEWDDRLANRVAGSGRDGVSDWSPPSRGVAGQAAFQ